LRRQGSKFASSEAFRVYKFTNGAWSDIILGAIMGAARRAELSRDDDRYDREPRLPIPAGSGAASPERTAPPRGTDEPDVSAVERRQASPGSTIAIDPEHAKRFGPYAKAYQPESSPYFSPPQAPRVRRAPPPPAPEADVTVKAANSNTVETAPVVPPVPEMRPATVFTIPRPAHQRVAGDEPAASARFNDRLASVTLQRETATFTVPVSEAVIPEALKAALSGGRRMIANEFAQRTDAAEIEGESFQELDFHGTDTPPAAHEPLSAADRALLRRIAPPAAE
jgi:hypothetical protein